MKCIISSWALKEVLKKLSYFIDSNPVVPILECVYVEVKQNRMTLVASNLQTTIRTSMDVDSNDEFKFCVELKPLYKVLSLLEEQPIILEFQKDRARLHVAVDNGSYEFPTEAWEDYPRMPNTENHIYQLNFSEKEWFSSMKQLLGTVSYDELRPAMTGVNFKLKEENVLEMCSTDGHRLTKCSINFSDKDTWSGSGLAHEYLQFIIRGETLRKSQKLLGNKSSRQIVVTVHSLNIISIKVFYENSNTLDSGSLELEVIGRPIDERFPDYDNAIPNENLIEIKWKANRVKLLNAAKRLFVVSNKATHQLKFKVEPDLILLSAEDLDFSNQGREKVTSYIVNPNTVTMMPFIIGFNGRFIIEMLQRMSGEYVEFHASAPNRGVLAFCDGEEDQKYMHLVMPIMLNTWE